MLKIDNQNKFVGLSNLLTCNITSYFFFLLLFYNNFLGGVSFTNIFEGVFFASDTKDSLTFLIELTSSQSQLNSFLIVSDYGIDYFSDEAFDWLVDLDSSIDSSSGSLFDG